MAVAKHFDQVTTMASASRVELEAALALFGSE
jgi:hypothetical protein